MFIVGTLQVFVWLPGSIWVDFQNNFSEFYYQKSEKKKTLMRKKINVFMVSDLLTEEFLFLSFVKLDYDR